MTGLAKAESVAGAFDLLGMGEVAKLIREIANELLHFHDLEAIGGGLDRRGPDVGVSWTGRNGFPCTCYWSSVRHGEECPEHGKVGVKI